MNIKYLRKKKFAVYGLGITGLSVINFFKRNNIKEYYTWDDTIFKKNNFKKKKFLKILDIVDYIVISPGIDIKVSKFEKKLLFNIIIDL